MGCYGVVLSQEENFILILPVPGLAKLDFSVVLHPVPDGTPVTESLGSLITSTTE